ncbi:MAG: TRAM domain-containing protein, partial [Acidobacteriota bacterium]
QIRERVPHIAFSTDIIVGFPTESEEDFEETLDVVRRVEYDTMFSFRYSKRPDTPAAGMGEQVPDDVARARHQRLLDLQAGIQARRFEACVGKTMEILVEGRSKKGTEWTGRAPDNKVVNFTSPVEPAINSLVDVKITASHVNSLFGEPA